MPVTDTPTSTTIRGPGLACTASALLAVPLAVLLGWHVGDVPSDQWSYPHPPGLFLVESLLLTLVHLLQAAGFVGALRLRAAGTSRAGEVGLRAGVAGLVGLSAAELASGLVGGQPVDSTAATAVSTLFGLASVVFGLGAVVGGVAVLRSGRWPGRWGWTVLAAGVAIFVLVTPANISGDLLPRQLALLVWSLLFVPLGLDVARRGDRRSVQ